VFVCMGVGFCVHMSVCTSKGKPIDSLATLLQPVKHSNSAIRQTYNITIFSSVVN